MALIQEGSSHYEHGGRQKDQYAADEVIEVACPLCGSEDRERLYTEYGAVGISRCRGCTLIYTSPRIKAPEEIYWGATDSYLSEARLIFNGQKPHHRDPNYLEELNLIKEFKPAGRFLDVGSSMGFLLNKARQHGYDVTGVEPSKSLAEVARKQWGLPILNCFLHEVPQSENHSFDVVALSDVFEHITEPRPFLREVTRLLKPDGVLYVKVPNGAWNLFKQRALALLGKRPSLGIWDSYEHVVHYTDKTLRAMLGQSGFTVARLTIGRPIQIPVWQDHVGHYYQYPSPWYLDWKRHTGRAAFYWASRVEHAMIGRTGPFAPNIAVIGRVQR